MMHTSVRCGSISTLVLAAIIGSFTPLAAQIRIGIQGGVPLSDFILDQGAGGRFSSSGVTSAPRRYTLGPYFEIPVRRPFVVEAGALYKRFGFDLQASSGGLGGPLVSVRSSTTGNSWEFPIAGRIRLRWARGLNGFVSLGASIRRLSEIHERGERTVRTFFPPPSRTETSAYETDAPPGLNRRNSFGGAISAGLEFRAGPLVLAPGIRLTRWDSERTSSMPSASRISRTQADALLQIGYVVPSGPESQPARLPCCFEPGIQMGFGLLSTYETPQPPPFSGALDIPTRRFAPGAFVEWRFHERWSVEAGFLMRRIAHTETYGLPELTQSDKISGNAWEVPLLVKWRALQVGPAQVVTGGGPALRRASHLEWIFTSNGSSFSRDASARGLSALGVAVSGGLDFRARYARVRPEFRFTWFDRPLFDFGYLRTRQNSAHFVLAVAWARSGR